MDLTVPGVRRGRAPPVPARRLAALYRGHRGGRTAELEFAASDPHAVHNHREFASYSDGRSLHAAPLGDGDTSGPQP